MTYVLDASALLRFLLAQSGSGRVLNLLEQARSKHARIVITAVNWGEVVGKLDKLQESLDARKLRDTLQHYGLEIVETTAERAEHTALFKNKLKVAYADAFCIELASTLPDHLLVTADFDFKRADQVVSVEFLPAEPFQ